MTDHPTPPARGDALEAESAAIDEYIGMRRAELFGELDAMCDPDAIGLSEQAAQIVRRAVIEGSVSELDRMTMAPLRIGQTCNGDALERLRQVAEDYVAGLHGEARGIGLNVEARASVATMQFVIRWIDDALSAAPAQQAGEGDLSVEGPPNMRLTEGADPGGLRAPRAPTPAEAAEVLRRVLEGLGDEAVQRVFYADHAAEMRAVRASRSSVYRYRTCYAAVLSALAAEAGRDQPGRDAVGVSE